MDVVALSNCLVINELLHHAGSRHWVKSTGIWLDFHGLQEWIDAP